MAKTSGLGWTTLSVDDAGGTPRDIRNDTVSVEVSTPREVWDVTGIDKSAHERLLLLSDFSVKLSGIFNPATGASHDVLKTVPSTAVNRTVSLGVAGLTLASECLFSDYPLKRDSTGKLTWDVTGQLADGAVPTWA